MNFLLHRHLAVRDLGSGAAGIGAMLPDLWRMADRRVRPRRTTLAEARPAPGDGIVGEVMEGVEHHLRADAWFHRAPVFTEGERLVGDRLRAAGTTAGRMSLLAHVVWEMCLDGALLRREGLAPVLAALRADFERTAAAAERAADLHHWLPTARPAEERDAFLARMHRLATELARGPWIEGYRDPLGLAIRAAGVRVRLGLAPLDPDDQRRVADALQPTLELSDAAVEVVLSGPSWGAGET
ncbi:MAG: hypothetical protein WKG00_02485 [Polyangiaceae bacterium]